MISHEHTPLNYKSRFITFLHLLVSPRKMKTYCEKGFTTCAICDAVITVPEFYFGHISTLICVILGFVDSKIAYLMPSYWGVLVIFPGSFIILYLFFALIFSFMPWNVFLYPDERATELHAETTNKALNRKIYWFHICFGLCEIFFR